MKLIPIYTFLILTINLFAANAQKLQLESLDSLLKVYEVRRCFNGEILVQRSDTVFYQRTIGYRENASKEKLKANLVYNIGSVAKPFTAVAILQLQEKGLVNCEDPVQKYIPAFPYEKICIKHLLSHTSGITGNADFTDENDMQKFLTNDSLISLLVKYHPPLQFNPGDQWSYSNLGYDVLSCIVERVTKLKFTEYMRKNIFVPAGMSRTFVAQTTDVVKWLPGGMTEKDIALPHAFEDLAACEVQNIFPGFMDSKAFYYGSSNVYTTASDLIKFDIALANHTLLNQTLQQLAYTPFKLNNGKPATDSLAPIPSYYGLGWEISTDTSSGKIIWHKGRSGGTRAVFLRNVSRNQVVAVLDNNDDWSCDLKAIACLRILNNQPYKNPVYQSLVQEFGCNVQTLGFTKAKEKLDLKRKEEPKNYFFSKTELDELASTLGKKNHLNDALAVSKLCNELFPGFWEGLLTNGDLYLKNKQLAEASECYKKAVPLFGSTPKDKIELLGVIGSQFIEANRLTDAELVLKLNTELFPEDCNSFDNYAFILDMNNKPDQAISVQEKAVALARLHNDPLLETLQQNLEKLKMKKGK